MKNQVLLKVLLAMLVAVIAGWLTGPDQELFGIRYVKIYQFMGQLFLNALNLVVVPLVCASIITGIAQMAAEPNFGTLGTKTFGFYLFTSLLAILVGLGGFFFFSPGISMEQVKSLSTPFQQMDLMTSLQEDTFDKVTQILLKLVPSNILAVASQGQMLGLIFFSILFGFFLSKIEADAATVMLKFWKSILQIMLKMTQLIMKMLPFGVFGLVAKVIATTGTESIEAVTLYFMTVLMSLCVYALVVLPLLLMGLGRVNPLFYLRALAPALFTAFSTSSSAATLPLTMECLEKRAGLSSRICNFTLPLGTSLHMSGGVLYLCVASLFIAQSYGIELSLTTISLVVLMALLTSMGIAGIPSASLISVVVILQTIGVPAEGVGLIMAVDRILDMFRTTVNVWGNATCAVLLAHSEREQEILYQT